jgi:RNA polymerase sigma-70 factor (ECF subfamily)
MVKCVTMPGEDAAVESELYSRFSRSVRLYGLKHLRDAAAADDLVQQVMITAIERLRAGTIDNVEQIGSFILGTSRLIARSMQRKEHRRMRLRDRFERARDDMVWTDDTAIDRVRIAPCLAAAGERERTILLLTFYAEQSASAIGEALGMTPGAVRVARHRAIEGMRKCVEGSRPA